MNNFPELVSKRLRLGKIRVKDIPRIVNCANNRAVSDHTLNLPYPYHEDDAVFWMNMQISGYKNSDKYIFGVYLKQDNAFIGGIGLHLELPHCKAELGYWISEPFWNQGLATEAGQCVIDFAFNTLQLNKIYATCFTFNPTSERVLKKLGMTQEAELKQHYFKQGRFLDVKQYALCQDDYFPYKK